MQLNITVYFAVKMTSNETFGKGSMVASEPHHAVLFCPQGSQVKVLHFIIFNFVLDFLLCLLYFTSLYEYQYLDLRSQND